MGSILHATLSDAGVLWLLEPSPAFANATSRAIFEPVGVKGFSSVSTATEPVASDGPCRSESIPAAEAKPEAPSVSFATVSHEALFHRDEATRCDACNAPLKSAAGSDDSRPASADESGGYSPQGRGVYLWQRGGELHFESAPLCPACASAIGVTALARWEIEEEEG